MNWGRHLLTHLDRNPAWSALGWETRGMALALMTRLAGAEGTEVPAWWSDTAASVAPHRGTLPNRPDTWRAVLGLPSRQMLQGAVSRTVAGRGSRSEILALDAAWSDAWLPELMNWFRVIDDTFLKDHPEYVAEAGRVWHPMLDCVLEDERADGRAHAQPGQPTEQLAGREGTVSGPRTAEAAADDTSSPKPARKKAVSRRRRAAAKIPEDLGTQIGTAAPESPAKNPARKPRKKRAAGKAISTDPIELFWDVAPWRPTLHTLERSWDPPLPGSAQARLWDDGATYLSDGSKESASKVRSIVGKLIKDYGEQAVAQGLAAVMTRTTRPADPVAFLRKTVHAVVHGSPAEERARAQRAKVPL